MPSPHGSTRSPQATTAARRGASKRSERIVAARAMIGYGREDEWRVLLTRELVTARAQSIAARIQARLLADSEAAPAFALLGEEARSRHFQQLVAWVSALDAPVDNDTAVRLADFARAHTSRGGGSDVHVKARHLVAAFGCLQAAITSLLFEHIGDAAELQVTISAWNKLLMLHLDIVLATYDGLAGSHWY